ncbi:MAG: hypothetical protein ABI707_04225 [Ferruginibacter sp.]
MLFLLSNTALVANFNSLVVIKPNYAPPPFPFTKRLMDIALIVFFVINLFFITVVVDLEQLVIANTDQFQ